MQLFFFITSGFTNVMPYNQLFFATHVAFISPMLYFFEGITHLDYGFTILHRIFGEYKFNRTHSMNILDFAPVIISSLFDAGLVCLFYGAWISIWNNDLHVTYGGKNLGWQTKTALNSIILMLFQLYRHSAILCITYVFGFINTFTLLLSLAFVLEDEYEAGVISLLESPYCLAIIIFFALILSLKWQVRHFYTFWSPKSRLLV